MRRIGPELWIALVAWGVALGLLAYDVQVDALDSPFDRAAAQVGVGWSFLVAGVVAVARRRDRRMGWLLVLAGFALLARQLRYSHDPEVFTAFFAIGDLGYALVGHAVLAYPEGRVRGRFARALVVAGYSVALLSAVVLLVYDSRRPLHQFGAPRESVITLLESSRLTELIQDAQVVAFFGVLATLLIGYILTSVYRATPRLRRVRIPLLVAAVAIASRAIFECVFTFVDRPFAYDYVFWWQIVAVAGLPLALLVGLFRAHLARAGIGELVVGLERTRAAGLGEALARALDDPSLTLALALPNGGGWVDEQGRPVELREDDPRRAVTRIEKDGQVLAALIHDPSLLEEAALLQAVGAAAHLALDNARLQAELRSQLMLVDESRARIVAAADDERRRIERNLHDGAQQRLVAIALELRATQRRLGGGIGAEIEQLLATTVDSLQSAVEELRELARGIHPAILAEGGLEAALDSLAARSPVPVDLAVTTERFAPEVESDAYFVACEALANVAKHAGASSARIAAMREHGVLRIEVSDDGLGGARLGDGTGLRGLVDRVEARGGRLRVDSPPGGGTRVVGEIPCGL